MVLVVEVSKQTIQALVPICGELLWMELFFWVNFVATAFSLCESCLVLGIAYNREEYFATLVLPPALAQKWIQYRDRANDVGEFKTAAQIVRQSSAQVQIHESSLATLDGVVDGDEGSKGDALRCGSPRPSPA
eukprot:scaffold155542_cov32-Tisochrysis_lutea.AAC.2